MSISAKGIVWGYGVQTVLETGVAATAGLRVRREGGVADVKPGMQPIEAPIMQGFWGDASNERLAGISRPLFSMPGLFRPGLLKLLLDQVMDPTAATLGWDYALLSGTDCIADEAAALTIWRKNTLAASLDKKLTGAIVKSIKIGSGSSGQKVTCDVEFLGVSYSGVEDGSAGVYTVPTEGFLLHSGLTFKIGAVEHKVAEWDITIDFGVHGIIDNDSEISEFMLGPLKIEGSVKVPWADHSVVTDFESAGENILTFLWGAVDVAGYTLITVPTQFNEPSEGVGEERLRQEISFKLAEQSAQAFEVSLEV